MIRKQYKSNQNLSTKWDAWDNKVPVFQFDEPVNFESYFEYSNDSGKYFNKIVIRHNLFGSKQ